MIDKELDSFHAFAEVLIKKSPITAQAPPFSAGAISTEDLIADISSFVRALLDDSPSTQAIGVTTGENVFQGLVAAFQAADKYYEAKRIKDRDGMFEEGTNVVRGVSQSVGGAAFLGYRGTAIAADIQHLDTSIKATSPLGQSAFALGLIGNVAFLIFNAGLGIYSAYCLAKNWVFSIGVKSHENEDRKLFNFLMQKVIADPRKKLEKLNAQWGALPVEKSQEQIDAFKESLADAALSKFTSHFMKWQNELLKAGQLTQKPLSKQLVKDILKSLFTLKDNELKAKGVHAAYLAALGLNEQDFQGYALSALELIGFKLEVLRSQAKKEAKFSRVTNQDCTDAVSKAAQRGLNVRLECDADALVQQSAKTELATLNEKIVSENATNKRMHTVLLVTVVLGILTTVLGFVALPPAGAIAILVLTLLVTGGMLVADGCSMLEGWKSGGMPGRYDKVYLTAISLVIVAAIAISIGVTLGFGFPLLPMILACVFGTAGLGLCGIARYKLTQQQNAWEENHPTLEVIQAALSSAVENVNLDEKMSALFKKLEKADRVAIRKKYLEMSSRGECAFKLSRYQQLDTSNDFGKMFLLEAIERDQLANDNEHKLMIRAMKKTVKFFWEKWAQTKSSIDQQRALKAQSLFERVAHKQLKDIQPLIEAILADPEMSNKLKNDIWYVLKRDENAGDLKRVVESVIQDKANTLAEKEQTLNKVTPLIQRMGEIFNPTSKESSTNKTDLLIQHVCDCLKAPEDALLYPY